MGVLIMQSVRARLLTEEQERLLNYFKKLNANAYTGFIVFEFAMGDIKSARPIQIKPSVDFEGSLN
jgi:hypothetical protein